MMNSRREMRLGDEPGWKKVSVGALLGVCALLMVMPELRAQEEPAADEPRRASGRLAWFVATAFPKDLENPAKVLAGGKLTEVVLPKRDPSQPIRIPSDGIIRIVREVANPEDPDKPEYETLARAVVPEGMQKALLILVPAAEKDAPLLYRTRVQSLSEFKGGDYLFLNLTTARIAVQMGETKLGLEPGKSRIYEAPRLDKVENTPIAYHYFDPNDDDWVLLSASTVVLRPTRREICVFSWDPRYRRIDYHGITVPVVR